MSRLSELRALLDAATPGPWIHRPPSQDGTIHAVVRDDPPRVYQPRICRLEGTGYSEPSSWAQRSADAALIAAAPEALALLLAFADEIKAACAPARGTPPDVWGATKDDVIEDVHAALARLEGTS